MWKRPIFGPATSLFVGRSPLWGCSLLTARGWPKSLAVPSTVIYEMASKLTPGRHVGRFSGCSDLRLSAKFDAGLWCFGGRGNILCSAMFENILCVINLV
jgi:hypothetical protein